ncbi:hypothetical protein TrLO_g3660 [Triparma laevis f. longispina]|uniref:Uncharacterized protein n=1 Tax=Triparma laevis f. longispina TaxID=1714387 RepID=A0A9W7F4V5_9STRA|nr:hypothetical protein TrLO_g3660 [Triparma laevis f. longispina]
MDMQRVQTHKQKNPLAKGVSSSVALGDGGEEPINIKITERTGSLHKKNLKEGGRSSECTTASKRMTFARGQSSLSYRTSDDYDPNDVRLGSVKKWVCYCKAHGKNPAGVCKNQEHIDGLVDDKHEDKPEGIIHAKYLQDLKGELKYKIDDKDETEVQKNLRLQATCKICKTCKSNKEMLKCPHLVHEIEETEKRNKSMWTKLHRKAGSQATDEVEATREFKDWEAKAPKKKSYIIDVPQGSMKHNMQIYEQKKVRPDEVEVHVKIMGISSLKDHNFKADIIVMYDWFDPEVMKIRQVGGTYNDAAVKENSKLFKPEFLILNTVSDAADAGKPTDESVHRINSYENGTAKMTARYISKELTIEDSDMGTWPYSVTVLPITISCRFPGGKKISLKHPNMRIGNEKLLGENAHANFHRYAADYDKLVEYDFFREVLCNDHDKDVNSWMKELKLWMWAKHVLHNHENEEVVKDQLKKLKAKGGGPMTIEEFFMTKDGELNADQKLKKIQNTGKKDKKTKIEMQEELEEGWLDSLVYQEKVEKCFRKWCMDLKKVNEEKTQYTVKVLTYQDPGNLHWNVTYPYFILEVLSLLSWGAKPDAEGAFDNRISILLTLLLTMVAFKNIISEKIPALPYLTLLDKFIIGGFLMMLLQGVYFMLLNATVSETSQFDSVKKQLVFIDWVNNDKYIGVVFLLMYVTKFWLTFKSGKLALLCQFRDFYPFTKGAPHKVRNMVLDAQFDSDSVFSRKRTNLLLLKYAGLYHGSFRHWVYKSLFKSWWPSRVTTCWNMYGWGEKQKTYDFARIQGLDGREEKFQKTIEDDD